MLKEVRYYSDSPKVDFDHMPEMADYTKEPPAMYVGCPGKHGFLDLVFELNGDGRSIMPVHNRRAPLIVQRELYVDEEMPEMPCVYILSSGGPNVDGDRYVQNFYLKKDSMAHISTAAATKLAEMKNNYSGMIQTITLEEGAYLEYLPAPLIPCKHTRYISDTRIVIDPTASLVYSEIFMPGRKYYGSGEIFQYDILSVCVNAERPAGEKLFREKFIIKPQNGEIRNIGVMGKYDVFANVVALTSPENIEKIYSQTDVFLKKDIGCGITHLPNGAGVLFKVAGMEPGPVKDIVRQFASCVREVVKGKPLPQEFVWR